MNNIYYKKGYKYQLKKDYQIQLINISCEDIETEYISLSKDGILLIRKGYAWDGPSGPALDTKSFMRGSLIHDALYQLIRLEKLSKEYRLIADLELKRICIEDGMNKIFAKIVYIYVRIFAEPFIDPSIEHEIEIAP